MTLDSDGGWRLRALVDDRKLSNYLLSTTHDAGKFKARFLMRHGFRPEAPHVLREALLEHAASAGVSTTVETAFGLKYVVAGRLASPDGRDPLVLSIWFESTGDPTVRLVTVYPRGGRK